MAAKIWYELPSESFVEKANLPLETRNYEVFKSSILTPENYVETCQSHTMSIAVRIGTN
jgi:hypothetical protein